MAAGTGDSRIGDVYVLSNVFGGVGTLKEFQILENILLYGVHDC